jgi:hypothetical protein
MEGAHLSKEAAWAEMEDLPTLILSPGFLQIHMPFE